MSPLSLVIVAGVVLVILWALGVVPVQTRRRLARAALYVSIVVGLLLLLRIGMPWLAGIGAFLLAALRVLSGPLLRLSPLLLAWLAKKKLIGANRSEHRDDASRGSDASVASDRGMTRNEALEILGLTDGASADEIRRAHAELIKRVHPDRGGTSYLATRVNLARDLLLPKDPR